MECMSKAQIRSLEQWNLKRQCSRSVSGNSPTAKNSPPVGKILISKTQTSILNTYNLLPNHGNNIIINLPKIIMVNKALVRLERAYTLQI